MFLLLFIETNCIDQVGKWVILWVDIEMIVYELLWTEWDYDSKCP